MQFKRTVISTVMAAIFALGMAQSAFAVTTFTVDPSAEGEPQTAFTANYIDFSYVALVDQTATAGTGTFTEEGAGFFGSFRYPTLSDAVVGTGINDTYKLYLTFTASGTVSPSASGGLDVTFTSFTGQIWLDPNADTTIAADATGAPNGTVSTGNTGDDILVGHTIDLLVGEAHVFPGLANGDFNVLVLFEPDGGFFSGPVFLGLTIGDINGVNTTLTGFSGEDFIDGRIDGSGNISFDAFVPEPSALLLLGSGLVGIAAFMRRRTAKK